jgi:colanic acid/amylovoran biosynthesis glycosyltransferase
MLIGYLVSQYPAASHTFIRREIDELRLRGLNVQTFSVRRPGPSERRTERDHSAFKETFYLLPVSVISLVAAHVAAIGTRPAAYFCVAALALKHRAPGFRALIWAFFHFAESIVFARELKRRRIQHLHNHFANSGATVGLLTSTFLGLPWSMTLHGVSETDYPAGLLVGRKIEAAQFVACVSHFARAQAMRVTSPDHWRKLFIVRCGLNLSAVPEYRLPSPRVRSRIICVGRLSPEKGQIGLLEAFSAIQAQGIEAELVLVGDGPERSRIERKVHELGLAPAVTLRGRLDEETTLLEIATSDLLVLPSFMEGLPIVLIEAMALGVPVVATHVAGIPELVMDEREGLLFRPGDWRDLAQKITRLLRDGELRRDLSKAARAKVEAEFEIGCAVGPLLARFQGTGLFAKTLSPVTEVNPTVNCPVPE